MNKISTYLTNYTAPSAGFSEGQIKDNPGDDTGSGAFAKTANDWLYALYALAKKYLPGGEVSDTDESETASDIMDSIEHMVGIKNTNTDEYENTTTYAEDDHVMRYGIQYVSMEDANLGNDPFESPSEWLPCFNREDALVKWRNGENISGGFEKIHDIRDSDYRQLFQWGKYNLGGDAGVNVQMTGVHLDGTTITGNATLEALFDVGGANEYHLLDIIAPDDGGTRKLLDASGCVAAAIDAGDENREIVGGQQDDAGQGWQLGSAEDTTGARDVWGTVEQRDYINVSAPQTDYSRMVASTLGKGDSTMLKAMDDNTNGEPRQGLETQMKNYSVGIPAIIIMQELP